MSPDPDRVGTRELCRLGLLEALRALLADTGLMLILGRLPGLRKGDFLLALKRSFREEGLEEDGLTEGLMALLGATEEGAMTSSGSEVLCLSGRLLIGLEESSCLGRAVALGNSLERVGVIFGMRILFKSQNHSLRKSF